MESNNHHAFIKTLLITFLFAFLLVSALVSAEPEEGIIDFESDQWTMAGGKVTTHLGRKALMGNAFLKDVSFENGTIEVDMAVTGARSYPGINFRVQSAYHYEHFYIRPHRVGLYPDALQYTPVFNRISGWQLYNGKGFTAPTNIPKDKWVHVKLEVKGTQARVFLDNKPEPALVIDELKHGVSKGSIGLAGPANQTAYFSNFKYTADDSLTFDPPPHKESSPGVIAPWKISQPFKLSKIDTETYPDAKILAAVKWKPVTHEPSGLINIARYTPRTAREPEFIFAKTIIRSDTAKTKKFQFGYSDAVVIFHNGRLVFTGNSAYRLRDPSFMGVVGYFDSVYLPLKKGDNEILMIVAEIFGGWGFMARDGQAAFMQPGMEKTWENDKDFKLPESVLYDSKRDVLYVSNYDVYAMMPGTQTISQILPDGTVKNKDWAMGLYNPLGMTMYEDKLYVVERRNLAKIDPDTGKILQRYPFIQPMFPNDVTVDDAGNFYVSDSGKATIYKLSNGKFEDWLKGGEINRPNGLLAHKGKLIVGNNGDGSLKTINLADKKVVKAVNLGDGIIDGIRPDGKGNLLVSHYEGRIYRISPSGAVTKLLDTSVEPLFTADFEYIPSKKLFIIPGLQSNNVRTYKIK